MPAFPISQPGASGRLPTAPISVTATAVSGGDGSTGSATVSWTASSNPGRATGTYVVRSYDSSNNPGPTASVSASATSVSVTGLTIGEDYTFKVELQSPYGLNSDQSSATTPAIRAFRRPTIGASTKGVGSVVAVSSMSHGGKADTWDRTTGSTTASATGGRSLSFSKVSGTGTQTLTQSGNDLNITGMSEDSSYVFRATWTNSRSSGVRITTSVNPEGRATTVSLSWGYSSAYTTYSATSGGSATVNIGNGSSPVSTTWVIEDSSGGDRVNTETLYFRVTATNSVDTARTSDDTHTTVATSTYTADTPSLKTQKLYTFSVTSTQLWTRSTYKDSYHKSPVIENISMIGGGGGGGRATNSYAGGGGGGNVVTASSFTANGDLHIYVGAGGAAGSSAGTNGSMGGTSSIYNYSTSSTQASATGGNFGYGTGSFWGWGGSSGRSIQEGTSYDGGSPAASNPSLNSFRYMGGGGAGKNAAGGAGTSSEPYRSGAGGAGNPNGAGGGGGGSAAVYSSGSGTYTYYYDAEYQAAGGATGGGSAGSNSNSGNGKRICLLHLLWEIDMAHFVFIDKNNIVQEIAVIDNQHVVDENGNEIEQLGIAFCIENYPMIDSASGRWIQASYNGKIRGLYPGYGYSYSDDEDIFISPQPFSSWIRNGSHWDSPTPMPENAAPGWPSESRDSWQWDEESLSWVPRESPFRWDEVSEQWIVDQDFFNAMAPPQAMQPGITVLLSDEQHLESDASEIP